HGRADFDTVFGGAAHSGAFGRPLASDGIRWADDPGRDPGCWVSVHRSSAAWAFARAGHDSAGHWHPHLLFYVPLGDAKTWGADKPDSPILATPRFNGAPEPLTELIIVVSTWSDGTPADSGDHAH